MGATQSSSKTATTGKDPKTCYVEFNEGTFKVTLKGIWAAREIELLCNKVRKEYLNTKKARIVETKTMKEAVNE